MSESFITFFGIYFLSLFKFIAGPILGTAVGYSLLEIILVTVSGMMSSVFLFTQIGTQFKQRLALRFKRKSPVFSKKSRSIVRIWVKYGEVGIAFITPLLLTPIGGTLILVSFGTKKHKIYFHMLWSSILWATILGLTIEHLLRIPFFERLFG
jgi:hypothetical protein